METEKSIAGMNGQILNSRVMHFRYRCVNLNVIVSGTVHSQAWPKIMVMLKKVFDDLSSFTFGFMCPT